jgi:ABC-type protease/lipase transport system fused ATPase/permease subunit
MQPSTEPGADASNPVAGAIRSIAPHLVFAFVFTAAVNLLFLASPIYMMQLYGRVLNSRSIETLVSLSIALLLALTAMAAADATRGRLLARAGARMTGRLTGPVARRALAEGKGRVAPAMEDVDVLRRFLGGGPAATLLDTPFTLLFLFILFLLHPMLGAVASLGGLAILCVIGAGRIVEARRDRRIGLAAQTVARLEAGLGADRGEARALRIGDGLAARLAKARSGLADLRLGAGEQSASIGATARFFRLAAHSAALATGAVLAIDGHLQPSAMLAAAILTGRALGPIEALPGALRNANLARAALDAIEKRLDGREPATVATGGGGVAIDARRLVAAPRGSTRAALRSISFTVNPGEVISVAGSSGAGKSMLLRCLAGAEPVKSGELRIDRIDVGGGWPDGLSARIGWLPQEAPLYPGTVRDNIACFAPASVEEVRRAAIRAGALGAIESLPRGFETEIEQGGAALSPQLRQAIAFTRALMGDPGLVLLDQPTAHMDAQGEVAALNAIRKLKSEGVTVLVVSHKPVLATLADRIMLIEDGTIEVFEDRETVLGAMRRQSLRAVAAPQPVAPGGRSAPPPPGASPTLAQNHPARDASRVAPAPERATGVTPGRPAGGKVAP